MPKGQRKYSQEFKEQAISLVTERGYTHAEAAKDIGVSLHTIKYWLKAARKNGAGQITPEGEETRRLRAENRQLRLENEILKKAAAYFAKESL